MKDKKFLGIQALRGIAACMVVIHHTSQIWGRKYGSGAWENGASGVDIFFVISGFVMAISSKKGMSSGTFLKNRVIRVVPLYWIMTALMLIKLAFSRAHPTLENAMGRVDTPLSYILSSLFFIPYTNSLGFMQPVLAQGWTLCYEMFFYLLFSSSLLLRVNVLKFLAPVLVFIAAVGIIHPMGLINPLVLEFLFGMLLGALVNKVGSYAYPLGAVAFLSLCLFHFSAFPGARTLQWGVPAFLVVMAASRIEKVPYALLRIGDASYSLYLSHLFVLLVAFRVIPQYSEVWMITACTVLSIAASVLIYLCIEKPVTSWLKDHLTFDHALATHAQKTWPLAPEVLEKREPV